MCGTMDCLDCKNELNLCKLCVKRAKIDCLRTCGLVSKKICADTVEAVHLMAENEVVNNLCVSQDLKANSVEALSLNANSLCSQDGVINKLCVNDLTVGNINHCVKWRAAVTLSVNTVYSLGSNVNWDVILDDPNGNVALSPFSYTVPNSGYYSLSYYLNSDSLSGGSVIAGIPIGLLTVTVNGSELRQFNAPYLAFSGIQKANLSSLVLLNAGDLVRMKYEVLVFDQAFGLVSYVGNANLKGNGLFPNESGFEIHYLSSLNCSSIMCQPCAPVSLPCQPVSVSCKDQNPCPPQNPPMDDPCDGCQ